ncbi:hypothetical protein [Persicirhabdus sediminis]|uniref:Uncharacterized protein n=1 Tax=Persicirhabdus sediminis TaxID=454144 RepID=A0A8J7MD61_9BACT|nr:hypothetical protein [Persicirhabdus sediminis]MBK1791001.1 hypothetical protein [Persicirhabdus sediminis]
MKFKILPLYGVLAVALSSCNRDEPSHLPNLVDKKVTVQFRRDSLGAASNLPIPPKTNNINGAMTSMSGILVEVGKRGIVVADTDAERWVPYDVILFVESPQD